MAATLRLSMAPGNGPCDRTPWSLTLVVPQAPWPVDPPGDPPPARGGARAGGRLADLRACPPIRLRSSHTAEDHLGLADQRIRLRRRELFAALGLHRSHVGLELVGAGRGGPLREGLRRGLQRGE
jgi:hypothetical protein